MKLNDIFTNLKKTINISGSPNKKFKLSPILSKNIDSFNTKLKKTLKINNPKKIIIQKNKKNIDTLFKTKKEKINLKNKIKNKKRLHHLKEKIFFNLLKIKPKLPNFPKIKKDLIKKLLYLLFFLTIFIIFISSFFIFIGYNSLKTLNKDNLQQQTNKALLSFKIAKYSSYPLNFIPIDSIKNIHHLASAGENISNFLNVYINIYLNYQKSKIFITDILKENQKKVVQSYIYLNNFEKNIEKTKIKRFNKIIKITKKINILLEDFKTKPSRLLGILGDNKPQKYLILFQNNDELRATGGFPGSVGILEFYKGNFLNFKKEDIYALEWNINKNYKNKIPAPEGINQVNPYFTLKDANYFSSYFQSANSINFFLQKGEYSFDGIIFINTNTINKILEEIGGIYFDKLNTKITSKNFNEIFSVLVEAKTSKLGTLGTPKQILFDFSKILEEKIKNNPLKIAKIIFEDIENREIAIINFNPFYNELFKKLGLNGEIIFNNTNNFIYPIFTSLSKNKSDRYLKIKYNIKTKIKSSNNNQCTYITNVNINLNHSFSLENKEKIKKYLNSFKIKDTEKILTIQGEGNNKQYLRIIIPKGSLIKTNNTIKASKNKYTNLIEAYTNISPQEKTNIFFTYILKNQNCENYSFKLIKQPGIKQYDINFNLTKFGKQIKPISLKNLKKDFYYIEK